jgi:hypothetical protein
MINEMRSPVLVLAAGIICALTGCSPPPEPPTVNPASSRTVRIHGSIDPSLTVKVSTQYISTEEKCRQDSNLAKGGAAVQATWVDSAVTRTGNEYETSVSLDRFVEGDCRWRPFMIAFQVTDAQGISTGQFVSSDESTTHVPGPEGKIWVSVAGQADDGDGQRRAGSAYVRPLELLCRANTHRGAKGLFCVESTPRELPLISEQATEVRVNFREDSGPAP